MESKMKVKKDMKVFTRFSRFELWYRYQRV